MIQYIIYILVFIFFSSTDDNKYLACNKPLECGDQKYNISYPFWGANKNSYCGQSGFELTCIANGDLAIDIGGQRFGIIDTHVSANIISVNLNDLLTDRCPDFKKLNLAELAPFRLASDVTTLTLAVNCDYNTSTSGFAELAFNCTLHDETLSYYTIVNSSISWGACTSFVEVPIRSNVSLEIGGKKVTARDGLIGGFDLLYETDNRTCPQCVSSGGICGSNLQGFACFCDGSYGDECLEPGVQRNLKIIFAVSFTGWVLLVLAVSLVFMNKRKKVKETDYSEGRNEEAIDLELPLFDLNTIVLATDNFSYGKKLGQGGYGPVYKGVLIDGREIAVKRLSETSDQGLNEFKNEVKLIAKLQHRNLVKLIGCCIQQKERMLIYEYLPNKSLNFFIFDTERRMLLNWSKRFDIINGIARGLLYLHRDSRLRIIHRDLKASNVLLDHELNPKISDFGLARSFGGGNGEINTNRVVGTYGYTSPEYQLDGRFSIKSDVFSFGVSVLEIVSSKRNRGFCSPEHELNLLGHAWKLYKEERPFDLIDESIKETCTLSEVLRSIHVGLLCVQHKQEDRPNMSAVVQMLTSKMNLPQPNEPGFYIKRDLLDLESSSRVHEIYTINELTITSLESRE